jgi:hypothetical protein
MRPSSNPSTAKKKKKNHIPHLALPSLVISNFVFILSHFFLLFSCGITLYLSFWGAGSPTLGMPVVGKRSTQATYFK